MNLFVFRADKYKYIEQANKPNSHEMNIGRAIQTSLKPTHATTKKRRRRKGTKKYAIRTHISHVGMHVAHLLWFTARRAEITDLFGSTHTHTHTSQSAHKKRQINTNIAYCPFQMYYIIVFPLGQQQQDTCSLLQFWLLVYFFCLFLWSIFRADDGILDFGCVFSFYLWALVRQCIIIPCIICSIEACQISWWTSCVRTHTKHTYTDTRIIIYLQFFLLIFFLTLFRPSNRS